MIADRGAVVFRQIVSGLRRRFRARHGPMSGDGVLTEILLDRRALYILPTREGLYYGAMLVVMLLAAINYSNGLAYALTFMLGAVSIVGTLQTHRNLSGLRLSAGAAPPVFAGTSAVFTVIVHNDSHFPRHAIEISAGAQTQRLDVAPRDAVMLEISAPAPRRGYLSPPALRLRTRFPLGLWHAWSRTVALPVSCLVFPRPAPEQPLPLTPDLLTGQGTASIAEGEDFAGLREYRQGDPMQRVAWKKAASGHGWHTKQFAAAAGNFVWLQWDALSGMDVERRLSLLCRWVLMAEQCGISYGLRAPGIAIPPAQGITHRDRCLERLALFDTTT